MFQKKPWIKPLSVAGSNMPLGNLDNNKLSTNTTSEYCKTVISDTTISSSIFVCNFTIFLENQKLLLEAKKVNYLEESLEIKRLKRTDTENYRNKKLDIMNDLVQTLKK